MARKRRKRLDPSLFRLPVDELKGGFYTGHHQERVRDVLLADGHDPRVLLQITGTSGGFVSGVDESIAILRAASHDFSALTVHALHEGDEFEPWDTVLTIEGSYALFAHLESVLLGVLTRRTRICTNTRVVVEAARPKPVLFIGAAKDFWGAQPGDGVAAQAGGALSVATAAQASTVTGSGSSALTVSRSTGMLPYALIAAYGGDTVRATQAFAAHAALESELIVPVDYENDCVRTALDVARALEGRLSGVWLGTPEHLVDRSVIPLMGAFPPAGVNPALVWNVRNALDAEGFGEVKIVVSGGLTAARVRAFEDEKSPVDVYGVGTSIVHDGRYDFASDVVVVDGGPQARAGRERRENEKLAKV